MARRNYLTNTSLFFIILASMLLAACEPKPNYNNPVVIIKTKFGDITVELLPEKAPITVGGFMRNVDSGYYKNSSFYRILHKNNQVSGSLHSYLIQGGIWHSNPELKDTIAPFAHEGTDVTGILHKRGVISMARNEPGTATAEFFICLEDEPGFDHGGENNADGLGYSAFGRVIEGMDVVERIYQLPEDGQRFKPPVTILNVVRYQKPETQEK